MFYTTGYTPIKKAVKRLTAISEDEKTRTLAELREKAQADYESSMANQREEGKQEGKIEQLKDIILMWLKDGKSHKEIASLLHMTDKEVEDIIEQLSVR